MIPTTSRELVAATPRLPTRPGGATVDSRGTAADGPPDAPTGQKSRPNEEIIMKTEKKRILVVDDRASDSQLVKLHLERTNDYVVREENDAKSALATAEQFRPQLILLDVMMPGMDGGELAANLQASPKLKAVPIVFLTALVTKGEVTAGGGRVGGYPFLAKPIKLSELSACIEQHLA